MSLHPENLFKRNKDKHIAEKITVLRAVNEAAELLLTADGTEDIDDVIISSLEIIGLAIDADRVLIWRDDVNSSEAGLKRLYMWVSEDGKRSPEVLTDILSPFDSFPEWHKKFRQGECAGGIISSLSESEQEFFGAYDIKTIFIIPMMLADTFWGIISIDDCKRERLFSADETAILRSYSLMVASAINNRNLVLDLIYTNELADAATKAKNAFLSNMSHEVRTPLNAIVGMAIVGRDSDDINEKNHALSKIGDASAHLLGIISNVLDMARIEEGKLEIVPAEFDFRDMLDKTISSLSPASGDKNQTVSINIDSSLPRFVIGDDARLSQVILNILSNAIKFTPAYGKISIDVSATGDDSGTFELQVIIKDNGIGIAEDQRSKLFTAFEQAHGALNRDYGGTGLGLPISKHIIELMGGKIWVSSEPNRGTTVVFAVRLGKGRADSEAPDAGGRSGNGKREGAAIVPGEFKGKRLLIAEDVEINREILIALLKSSGIIIECAEDGQVALDMVMFNVEKYDAVFMDLQMPNMGGLESARRIRQLPERKRGRLPIIAMTANVMAEDINACFNAGMDDHLSKPLDIEKVLGILRKYLPPD